MLMEWSKLRFAYTHMCAQENITKKTRVTQEYHTLRTEEYLRVFTVNQIE